VAAGEGTYLYEQTVRELDYIFPPTTFRRLRLIAHTRLTLSC
jgi:hypothetical protein